MYVNWELFSKLHWWPIYFMSILQNDFRTQKTIKIQLANIVLAFFLIAYIKQLEEIVEAEQE